MRQNAPQQILNDTPSQALSKAPSQALSKAPSQAPSFENSLDDGQSQLAMQGDNFEIPDHELEP